MNTLSIGTHRELYDQLHIDLLVDGVPIEESLPCDPCESGIPFHFLLAGLPLCDASGDVVESEVARTRAVLPVGLLVSVCSCGVAGCGHTRCQIVCNGGKIELTRFIGERNHPRAERSYIFEEEAFRAVEDQIRQIASAEAVRTNFRESKSVG